MLGASFDPPGDNKAFADEQHFGFRLLSDTDRSVGGRYEVVRDQNEKYSEYAKRIAYLIDPEGTIRMAYDVADVHGFASQVLADLAALGAEGAT